MKKTPIWHTLTIDVKYSYLVKPNLLTNVSYKKSMAFLHYSVKLQFHKWCNLAGCHGDLYMLLSASACEKLEAKSKMKCGGAREGEGERERERERESDSEETHRLMDTRRRMECRWTYWCYYRLHKSSFHKNIENVTLAFDRGQNVTQKTFFVTDQVSDFGFVFQMI